MMHASLTQCVCQKAHVMHAAHQEPRNLLATLASPWAALDEVLDGRV